MDDKDRLLLSLLLEDSSQPLKTIAAAVGLSRSSVRERIERLRSAGVLRRYTVEIAPEPGSIRAILLVRLDNTPNPAVVGAITKRPNVCRCYSLSGPVDLLVELVDGDLARLNRTRDEIALLTGVADVETAFVLNRDKATGEN